MSTELNTIKSAYKVFDVLETIVKHKNLSIGKISEITGYTKSTTQRIVNTLRDLEYINQYSRTLNYYPSIKLYELGLRVINDLPIKTIARYHLLELFNKTNETVNLGILNGNNVVYLDKLVSTSPLRVELELGVKVPIYCSALGKSIAAFSDRDYSFEGKYIKHTKNTIDNDKELHDQLKNIRKIGYALDDEEYVEGLICISVPILSKDGLSLASISISKPKIRFDYDNIDYYVELMKDCADKISLNLY